MKYVIKNCPAIRFKLIPLKENPICSKMPFEECCKDITDCLLKRIVELCREQKTIECNIDGKKQVLKAYYHTRIGDKILELLEIEEA